MNHRPLNEYRAALLNWLSQPDPAGQRAVLIVQTSASNRGCHLVCVKDDGVEVSIVASEIKRQQINALWSHEQIRAIPVRGLPGCVVSYYAISIKGFEDLEEWKAANGKPYATLCNNGYA